MPTSIKSDKKATNSTNTDNMSSEDHLERIQNEKTLHFQTAEDGVHSTNPSVNQGLGIYHTVKGSLQRGLGELVNSEALQFKGEAELEKGQAKLEISRNESGDVIN
jgi:uncharacterized protein YjbJ (UPF0337 family)